MSRFLNPELEKAARELLAERQIDITEHNMSNLIHEMMIKSRSAFTIRAEFVMWDIMHQNADV